MVTILIIVTAFLLKLAQTLRVSPHNIRSIEKKIFDDVNVKDVLSFLNDPTISKISRRSLNPEKLAKARELYKILRKTVNPGEDKPALMKDAVEKATRKPSHHDEHAVLVESELKNSLSHKKSALFDRPYVENNGPHDFLVLRPGIEDPFVTVIPNAIYYNAEKKCVNWLDDCSLKGIRARLLRGVQSPYK